MVNVFPSPNSGGFREPELGRETGRPAAGRGAGPDEREGMEQAPGEGGGRKQRRVCAVLVAQ